MISLKRNLLLAVLLLGAAGLKSQVTKNYTEKGNRLAGLNILLTGSDVYSSHTELDFNKNSGALGLLLQPTYGVFVERNWLVGGQLNLGYHYNNYKNSYASSYNYNSEGNAYDLGFSPLTRYYIDLGSRQRVKLFGLVAVNIGYSANNYSNEVPVYNNLGQIVRVNTMKTEEKGWNVRSSFGIGCGLFGKAGSIDLQASNQGLLLGLFKVLAKPSK